MDPRLRFSRLLSPDQGELGSNPAGDPPANGAGDPPKEKDTQPQSATAGDPPPKQASDSPDDKGAGGKDAILAELSEERKKRQGLEGEIKSIKDGQESLKKSLLKALGHPDGEDGDPEAAARAAALREKAALSKAESALKKAAVVAEAGKLNVLDMDAVWKLGDWDALEVDLDKGVVKGAADAVSALIKEKDWLVKKPGATPAGGQPAGSDPSPEGLKKDELVKLAKKARAGDEIAALELMKRNKEFLAAGIKPEDY